MDPLPPYYAQQLQGLGSQDQNYRGPPMQNYGRPPFPYGNQNPGPGPMQQNMQGGGRPMPGNFRPPPGNFNGGNMGPPGPNFRPMGNQFPGPNNMGRPDMRYSPTRPMVDQQFRPDRFGGRNQPSNRGGANGGGPPPKGPRFGGGGGPFRPHPGNQMNGPQGGGREGFQHHNGPPQQHQQPSIPTPPPSNIPPPPGATFEYHPTHWVHLSGPLPLIASMPPNSRLFMGNLASERTDRTELARIFAPYGNIAEISLKGSFGFVQFDNPESCQNAMVNETGRRVAGMSMDLKISRDKRRDGERKPSTGEKGLRRGSEDHGRRDGGREGSGRRRGRSRSPPGARGGRRPSDRSPSYSSRDSDDDHRHRRDDRRRRSPRRSSSPAERNAKDSLWADNKKTNGAAAPGTNDSDNMFGNVRLPTPTMSAAPTGSGVFPLPMRFGPNVPEAQIVVLNEVDRTFVVQVESTLRNAGIKAETLHFDTNLSLRDVVHQMMVEGVRGVIFLERRHAISKTVSMQVFQANGNVAEYDKINPEFAAMIVLRDRSVRPIVQPQLNGQLPAANTNNLASMLGSLLGGSGNNQTQLQGGNTAETQALLALVANAVQQQQQQQQLSQLTQGLGVGTNALASLGLGGLAGFATNPNAFNTQQQQPQQQNLGAMLSSLMGAGQLQQPGGNMLGLAGLSGAGGVGGTNNTKTNPLLSSVQHAASPTTNGAGPVASLHQQQGAHTTQTSATQPGLSNVGVAGAGAQAQQKQESVADLLNRLKSLQQLNPAAHPQ
ncbi:uncharacterized protein EV422DRAFT_214887 [Fimicolochytrium jonesii]|uniref:uncharacterized protein n=1 Tax=Fimicolochytrium jonesii TaxID=1396493 RepID=UPI0022FE39DD|nr:uncharacterized protein EV422DRAFT_214887 [Fimicolochytrium jonesii]KAI8817750.1 hypothetical protein EV422DRAFT_214887 [Fimicolochytrium jonesii]